MESVLKIQNIHVEYRDRDLPPLMALRDISLDMFRGECLAIVGESGSGKSTLIKACMGLLEKNAFFTGGSILYKGQDLVKLDTEKKWDRSRIRGRRLAMVMQDPTNALDPIMKVGAQIAEAYSCNLGIPNRKSRDSILDMLKDAGFDDPEFIYNQYPGQLSGGMNQRIAIAMAVVSRPEILFCDECTSALDVTTQAIILDYLGELRKKKGITLVLVTHDMGIVARMADRVAVMYAGQIVETGLTKEVFFDPRHPYTWTLLSSMPQLIKEGEEYIGLKGSPPDLRKQQKGDAFAPRNPFPVLKIDREKEPPMFQISLTHMAKTWLLDPRAPIVHPPNCIRRIQELK